MVVIKRFMDKITGKLYKKYSLYEDERVEELKELGFIKDFTKEELKEILNNENIYYNSKDTKNKLIERLIGKQK